MFIVEFCTNCFSKQISIVRGDKAPRDPSDLATDYTKGLYYRLEVFLFSPIVQFFLPLLKGGGADMEFVKNFTQPDFQAINFTPQKCVNCDIFLANQQRKCIKY